MTHITIAYSPDTDDAFMVYAMRQELVDTGSFTFSYTTGDIETLNEAAKLGSYDICAISVAAYPAIRSSYLLMPVGASVGVDFGPAIIVKQNSSVSQYLELQNARIGVPGLSTSAHLAAQHLFGPFEAVPYEFQAIETAVEAGEVDAGILIHERQIAVRQEFRSLGNLGQLWQENHQRPLPLGTNAIRRSLGLENIKALTEIYTASVKYGLNNRQQVLEAALRESSAPITLKEADRYIEMYVNKYSVAHDDAVLAGMQHLLDAGSTLGLYDQLIVADHIY